jgi:Ca-activated chloride channel homolog
VYRRKRRGPANNRPIIIIALLFTKARGVALLFTQKILYLAQVLYFKGVLVTVMLLLFLAGAFASDQAVPTFEAKTEIVNLTISVTDKTGQFVVGLSKEDFVIFEDGIPQRISLFEAQHLPIDMMILLDRSASMSEALAQLRQAATSLIGSLRDGDEVTIEVFASVVEIICPFTKDFTAAEASLAGLAAKDGDTRLKLALVDALSRLDKHNSGQERRKVVILITDGEDNYPHVSDDRVMAKLQSSGATVYAIQPVKRYAEGESAKRVTDAAFALLSQITNRTGGRLIKLSQALNMKIALAGISDELRNQYRIGYESSSKKPANQWRSLNIIVRNGRAQHRSGYQPKK